MNIVHKASHLSAATLEYETDTLLLSVLEFLDNSLVEEVLVQSLEDMNILGCLQ